VPDSPSQYCHSMALPPHTAAAAVAIVAVAATVAAMSVAAVFVVAAPAQWLLAS